MSSASVIAILEEAQKSGSAAACKQSARKLQSLLSHAGAADKAEMLVVVLRGAVDRCLVCAKKEASVERVLKFFCEFLASTSDEGIFRTSMEHLLARSLAGDKNVRYRVCQTIAGVISNMSSEATISDELCEAIIKTLTPRLRDKAPNVRMWAIKALARLQNASDDKDVLVNEFVRLMASDPSTAVRVAAVDNLSVCKRILPDLVARVRDIKSEVRVAALEHLAKDVDVRHLSISQRATIVQFGLNDRDATAKAAAVELVLKWVSLLENKVPKLLHLVNLAQNLEACELLGMCIIEEAQGSSSSVTPALKQAVRDQCPRWQGGVAAISASEVLWAQIRCEQAHKTLSPAAAAEVSESLIPDTIVLCGLLSEAHGKATLHDSLPLQLTVRHLLRMTSFLEQTDVSGGAELIRVCEAMLIDVRFPESLVEPVLDAWVRGLGKADHASIINSITALSEKFQSAMTSEEAVAVEEEQDLEVLAATRGLQLVAWSLRRGINGADANYQLSKTFSSFILDSLQSTSPDMRCLAVRCLGIMGLSSEEICESHREILQQVASTDLEDEVIRAVALQALSDMATVHTKRFSDDAVLTNLLLRLQESADTGLRLVAAESAAKLLFAGTLSEPRLFANLLKFFFLPELSAANDRDEEEEQEEENDASLGSTARLQQILSVFFNTFFVAGNGREKVAWESISDLVADIAMLVRDGDAESSAIQKIMHHLLNMCENVKNQTAEEEEEVLDASETARIACRARLSAAISREVLKLGNCKAASKDFIKVLVSLAPSTWATPQMAKTMLKVTDCILHNVTLDKTTKTALENYMASCSDVASSAAPEALAGDNEEAVLEEEDKAAVQEYLFYSFAPGLLDLVELMGAGEEPNIKALRTKVQSKVKAVGASKKAAAAATASKSSKSSKRATEESDDDEEEDEDDEDEEEDEEGEEEAAPVTKSRAAPSSRPARNARANALSKISQQAEAEEEHENTNPQRA